MHPGNAMTAKKKAAKTRASGPKPKPRLSREDWEALLMGPEPSEDRRATRSDADVALELKVTRQAVQAARSRLEIEPFEPPVEIETPPADASLHIIVGWRIRLHRVRLGWTLKQIAEGLGGSWDVSGVSAVERSRGVYVAGMRRIEIESLQAVAGLLGVSPADLLLLPGQTSIAPALDFQGGPAAPAEAAWVDLTAEDQPELRAIIGVNVARWRCLRGWNQTELAEQIADGWSQSRVSNVERGSTGQGSTGITLAWLRPLAEALQITPADLARLPRQPPLVPLKPG